jgi:N-formylglutamate deformylase
MSEWLIVRQGDEPLVVSFPHTGSFIPKEIEQNLISPWLSRKDTDWGIDQLYNFAEELGATLVRTTVSRTVVDVNRDPLGNSLYPGQATTALCPTTTFDGEALYREGAEPSGKEIARRQQLFFDPYHAALTREITRLRRKYASIVLYDAHSIRSVIPRLFNGILPNLNIGTDDGRTADTGLIREIEACCGRSQFSHVTNGRFRGGWTTRHYGDPARGIHAVQMEIACRTYIDEPERVNSDNWPPMSFHEPRADEARAVLKDILVSCVNYTRKPSHDSL